jgi:hypothetical protein
MRGRTTKTFELGGVEDNSGTEALVFTTIHALLYLTTLFSMLVGAINIMNIMLVTVTERTREIGVRRALGRTRSDIVGQFLAETIAVTAGRRRRRPRARDGAPRGSRPSGSTTGSGTGRSTWRPGRSAPPWRCPRSSAWGSVSTRPGSRRASIPVEALRFE